ncbi:MAG: hypothetical protein WAM79_16340 [Candidatus Sulfotelmatobacter sp.]
MQLFTVPSALLLSLLVVIPVSAQNTSSNPAAIPVSNTKTQDKTTAVTAPAIPANTPHMSKQTRYEIIRDFETQLVYSRTSFPMGTKGLDLKQGQLTPNGQELDQLLAVTGPSIRPGDPARISYVRIKGSCIHFDLNGGAIRRKKWYQHIEVAGASGEPVPLANDQTVDNPHGSYLDVYFDKYVPEMTPAQLRAMLYPALDFNARSKEQAYLDTVPPKVKAAILAHHVLVGMNSEMVLHAMGKPPQKDREKDQTGTEYEEWIYGQPPQDVDFVRFIGDEVVRVETMKVDGQKIVRTQKEVILAKPEDEEAKKQDRPANAPSLRRPGESQEDVPNPANGPTPAPPAIPPDIPQPPGPNDVATR